MLISIIIEGKNIPIVIKKAKSNGLRFFYTVNKLLHHSKKTSSPPPENTTLIFCFSVVAKDKPT